MLHEMIADGLREGLFVQLSNGSSQNTVMGRGKYFPDLHRNMETVQETKITLIGCDEDTLVFGGVFEVKGIVTTSQAELHCRGYVVAVLLQERRKR